MLWWCNVVFLQEEDDNGDEGDVVVELVGEFVVVEVCQLVCDDVVG